jgi:hypothetical protein
MTMLMRWRRKSSCARLFFHVSVLVLSMWAVPAHSERLDGTVGAVEKFGSGWIDLQRPVDFLKGDRLRLVIGGNATSVVIRLLAKDKARDSSEGLLGGPVKVPKTRVVEVVLREDRLKVVQISVHGGPNPWGHFPMPNNGPAALQSVERISSRK